MALDDSSGLPISKYAEMIDKEMIDVERTTVSTSKLEGKLQGEAQYYFLRFAFGLASLIELACIKDSHTVSIDTDFEIIASDSTGSVLRCTQSTALELIRRLGGSYKVARIFSEEPAEAIQNIELPFEDKFSWTISAYNCNRELVSNAKEEFNDFFKSKGLRKSRFISPDTWNNDASRSDIGEDESRDAWREKGQGQNQELKVSDLLNRIFETPKSRRSEKGKRSSFVPNPSGIDFVVHGGIGSFGRFFGYTIGLSDVQGFQMRDFGRPYQDPTITLSPRLARLVVNTAASKKGGVLLDPFCGLGTLLQEGLVCGFSIVGVDKKGDNISRARSNLAWLSQELPTRKNSQRIQLMRQDARRIDELPLPKVDFVASEAMLLPSFKKNPTESEAREALARSRAIYEAAMERLVNVLSSAESRIALISPTIIDSAGRPHTLTLKETAKRLGLKEYTPSSMRSSVAYPLRLETQKKKIVMRNLNLFSLS